MIMFNNMKINMIFKLSTRWHHLTYPCSMKMYMHTCNSLTPPRISDLVKRMYINKAISKSVLCAPPPPLHLAHAVILIKRLNIIVILQFS